MDEGGVAHFDFVCPVSYDEGTGIAHGGWAASVLSEMVGHALILSGSFGYLGTLNIRYSKPVPVGVPLVGSAHVEGRERRKVFVNAEITTTGLDTLATASAVLITTPT
jgi:acyl-coenzyme A thioesterase PaaI-like protein